MSEIEIRRQLKLNRENARSEVDKLARDLNARYELRSSWDDDTLKFERKGINGFVNLDGDELYLKMKLGFVFRPFKGRIEQEITKHLDGFTAKT